MDCTNSGSAIRHFRPRNVRAIWCAESDSSVRMPARLPCRHCASSLFAGNGLRVVPATFVHWLFEPLHRAPAGASLAPAGIETIRLRLPKAGARVRVARCRIQVAMAEGGPDR